jgi:hypothetical protein
MNHEEKKATVERLKQNERGYFALSADEKRVILEIRKNRYEDVEFLCSDGYFGTPNTRPSHWEMRQDWIYRIAPDYQLPGPVIEPPEGYRIVSDVERGYKFPEDCPKKGAWMRYPVNLSGAKTFLSAETPFGECDLHQVVDVRGFGGAAFADAPGDFRPRLCKFTDDGGVIDPVAVRFWVEG